MPAASIYKILYPAFLDHSVLVSTYSPQASDNNLYSVRANAFVINDLSRLNVVAVNRDKSNTVPFQVNGISGYNLNAARLLSAITLDSDTIMEGVTQADTSGTYSLPPMTVLILEYDNIVLRYYDMKKNETQIMVYPNPTDKILHFSETIVDFEILNLFGQRLIVHPESATQISIETLSDGIYFLKIEKGLQKFVVKH